MNNLIKTLSEIIGVSGSEARVSDFIIKELPENITVEKDKLGNLIVFKKGKIKKGKKLAIFAHMDEVGLIATYIEDSGLIRFSTVGGIDVKTMVGRSVEFYKSGIKGVIGTKAVHLQDAGERDTVPKADTLYIDIGAKNKEQTLEYVAQGDCATFISDCVSFGDGLILGRALDDRAGCAVLLELLKEEFDNDVYFVFTTQEEVGLRGAKVSTYTVDPDFAIVVEATTAADIAGVSKENRVCALNNGPAISFMDNHTIYDKELYSLAFKTAKDYNIPCQVKSAVAGGNDAGAIHTSSGGVQTLCVSIPCRYLHTANCVISGHDYESTKALVRQLIIEINKL